MTKLHLDTDIGGDIDDLCALAMVLAWPDADLVAVTTCADDRGRRAGYARYTLDLAARPDVPVASGADVSLGCYRVRPGFPAAETAYWPEAVPPAPTPAEDALALLERSIESGAVIAAIGPLTNLALLEKRRPGILAAARLVVMGGYVFPPREGYPRWERDSDWNVQEDVESARLVLRSAHPILVPVTVTAETALRRSHIAALAGSRSALARLVARQAEAFAADEGYEARYGRTCRGLPADIVNFLHDPLACAVALGWNGAALEDVPLSARITDGWLVFAADPDGSPTRLVKSVEGAAFSELWLRIVACRTDGHGPAAVH